jgi:hypothetical protein
MLGTEQQPARAIPLCARRETAVDDLDRRTFLMRTSLAAAAAGVAAAVPLGASALAAPAAAAAEPDQPVDMPDPVVAHVRDAATGEIALYVGDREVTVRDRRLASQLVKAVS